MCHRSWSFPTFQLRFLCIVLIFRQMARLPGPALELYPTPASEFLRRECLFLKSANQSWRLSFNGMACGIAYSWSNACGWEDGWSRPPESHMRSWKQWVQSALYHLGRDGSAQRGCDIRVFGGREMTLNPMHHVQTWPRPSFHSPDICQFSWQSVAPRLSCHPSWGPANPPLLSHHSHRSPFRR